MRADLIVKGKSLTGSSDLTLLAPLKSGWVPALEAVSYRTRTQRLLKLLNGGRTSAHEFSLVRPISDSVERVARIHSFRVAVLLPEDKVLLAVTFDGTWEAYIRVLWQKVGTLLDVIFCNTQGYVISREGFDAWCGWVRRVQVETGFFFNTHGLTVSDVHYLRAAEHIQRSAADPAIASLAGVRLCSQTAEALAYEVGNTTTIGAIDTLRQGLQALALLFRMTDLYLPGTPDGDVLLRAARDLLIEFSPLVEDPDLMPDILHPIRDRFARQLDWLRAAERPDLTSTRPLPALSQRPAMQTPADVQGGMLAGYDDVTHACLVMLALDDAAAGARLLEQLRARVTPSTAAKGALFGDGDGPPTHPGSGPFYNLAFTFEGLLKIGVREADLAAWLPEEFREGMEARASMLGDFRANHPRRWPLPSTNWQLPPGAAAIELQMSAVHLVVQIRAKCGSSDGADDPGDSRYALLDAIRAVVPEGGLAGVRVLCVQPMKRLRNAQDQVIEHFGFADGSGQPEFTPGPADAKYRNQVQLGEVLIGYPNEADPAPAPRTRAEAERMDFLRNGSFMVVRKLTQDVPRLRDSVQAAAEKTGLAAGLVLAKMMGRWQNGASLVTYPDAAPAGTSTTAFVPDTDFTYDDDAQGSRCPFHAHIRRTNPRTSDLGRNEPAGRRRPRILRRSMSYGPPATLLPGAATTVGEPHEGDDADRGIVFIAYNASIAEQFEVVQRWVSGGNSSAGYSGHSDPFLGVPEPGQQRHYRFEATDSQGRASACTMPLDSAPAAFDDPQPFVRLQWGAYLFVPSMRTLGWLREQAGSADRRRPEWPLENGRRTVERLERMRVEQGDSAASDGWKGAIEDSGAQEELQGAALWAAVRERGGALRTPYGVLVASRALVDEVLADDRRFSVCGYRSRMLASRFDIYLGLDHGSRYLELSSDVNQAIGRITKQEAFDLAAAATEAVLRSYMDVERASSAAAGMPRWELDLDARDVVDKVQQHLCQQWLGLPRARGALVPGSWDWTWTEGQPPVYPTHFTPPSRYFFQPRPGDEVRRYGERYAAALAAALQTFIEPHRAAQTVPMTPGGAPAYLAEAILQAQQREDDATVARTFAGVLMGFLPTLDANLRLVLNEWLRQQTLWSLRAAWAGDARRRLTLDKAEDLLEPALRRAMQFRPSPELIWRTALVDGDRIGGVPLEHGDVVVVGLVSALHENLEIGGNDVMPVFGGDRSRPAHPTHACPGYNAAIGVMLGVLAAFVDVKETMRPSPAPLAFAFEGPLP